MSAPDNATVAIVMAKLEYLRADNDALRAELDTLRTNLQSALPFIRDFVENCYAEWSGSEYRCGFCAAGKREHRQEQEFLNKIQEHAEGCAWREAKLWYDANAPKKATE